MAKTIGEIKELLATDLFQKGLDKKLIIDYDYLPQNISVNESVQMGAANKEADILVYNDTNNRER
jgi:hypothetical protein